MLAPTPSHGTSFARIQRCRLPILAWAILILFHPDALHAGRIIQEFQVPLGTWVTPGSPEPGAGVIENEGDRDLYNFNLALGQTLYFEDRGGNGALQWQLFDPKGRLLFKDALDYSSPSEITVTLPGVHALYVQAADNDPSAVGTYSIRIWDTHPLITSQPQSIVSSVGKPLTLTVAASTIPNLGGLSYQWRKDGKELADKTDPLLRIPSLTLADQGSYDVIASDSSSSVTSQVAVVTIDAEEFTVRQITPNGRVNKAVSQFEVEFTAPVKASTLGLEDFALSDTNGPLSLAGASLTALSSTRFRLTLPNTLRDGVFDLNLGLNVQSESGQSLRGGTFQEVYPWKLDGRNDALWNNLQSITNASLGVYLGVHSEDALTLTLPDLPPHTALRFIWNLAILGPWDGDTGPNQWGFKVNNGELSPAWEFSFSNGDGSGPQSYPEPPVEGPADLFGTGSLTTLYDDIVQDVPHTNSTLFATFYGRGLQFGIGLEWALGVVRVQHRSDMQSPFQNRVHVDIRGAYLLEDPEPQLFLKPADHIDLTFSEPIDPSSLSPDDIQIQGPLGVIPVVSVERVSPTNYMAFFAKQRINTNYVIKVGPDIFDAATNGMDQDRDGNNGTASDIFESSFEVLVPPNILSPAKLYSVVRNTNLTFSVSYEATPPVNFQWTKNTQWIADQTNETLVLTNVQPEDSATYRVIVSDKGGSTISLPITLDVKFSHGLFITQELARLPLRPKVPGHGVNLEIFNGLGGGGPPTPLLLRDRKPTETLFSPEIDFPRPGALAPKSTQFQNFFTNTILVPEAVRQLTASNFVLRSLFLLNIQPELDRFPDTPEIDLQISIGSDDGFHFSISNRFLISAGDRAFNYSTLDLSFETPGLYPVSLLYVGNASPTSGLELNWLVSSNATAVIIPQSALYSSLLLGDQLLTWDDWPSGTTADNQYKNLGIVLSTSNLTATISSEFADRLVSVSKSNVVALAPIKAGEAGSLEIRVVQPGTDIPAVCPTVSFFLIDAESPGTWIRAYDVLGQLLFEERREGGNRRQEIVTINRSRTHRIVITPAGSDSLVGIDNLTISNPKPILDLAARKLTNPTEVSPGRRVLISWDTVNQGTEPIRGYSGSVYWAPLIQETNTTLLSQFTSPATLPVGAITNNSVTVTIPPDVSDAFLISVVVTPLDGTDVAPDNNTLVSAAIQARVGQKPDLSPSLFKPPSLLSAGKTYPFVTSFENGSVFNITQSWVSAILVYNPSNTNPPVELARMIVDTPLSASGELTFTQNIYIPFTLSTGLVQFALSVDTANQIDEEIETNNILFATSTSKVNPTLGLTLSTNQLVEGGAPVTMLLQRNGDISDPLVVTLLNTRPERINIPTPIKFQNDEGSLLLNLSIPDDNIVPQIFTQTLISVLADGFESAQGQLQLLDNDQVQMELAVQPETINVEAGLTADLLITLLSPPLPVSLDMEIVMLPEKLAFITPLHALPAGETNLVIPIQPIEGLTLSSNITVQIIARLPESNPDRDPILGTTTFTLTKPETELPFTVDLQRSASNEITLKNAAQVNRSYVLEISVDLQSWIPVSTNLATSSTLVQTKSISPTDPPTFMRVRSQ